MEEEERYLKKQRIYKIIMLMVLTAFITSILTTIYIAQKNFFTRSNRSNLCNYY